MSFLNIAYILHPAFYRHTVTGANPAPGIYTYEYLFGNVHYYGSMEHYRRRGITLHPVLESDFLENHKKYIRLYDGFDFQFAAETPEKIIGMIRKNRKKYVGWGHSQTASRAYQYKKMENTGLLPWNKAYKNYIDFVTTASRQNPESEYLIVKNFCSTRSRLIDGTPYGVLHRRHWSELINTINPALFYKDNGLQISGLITTCDPFANRRNGIVHKAHFVAHSCINIPLDCDKLLGKYTLMPDRIYKLDEVLHQDGWAPGHLNDYKEQISNLPNLLYDCPCLVSGDFVINPEGKIFFLEFNKIGATFLNKVQGKTFLARFVDIAADYFLTHSRV